MRRIANSVTWTNVREFKLLGKATVDGRAHCMDKRAYDITHKEGDAKFTLRSCEIETC